jgi:heat shock protein HslJ
MRARALTALLLLAAAACRSSTAGDDDISPGPAPTDTVALEGTRWTPVELGGRPVPTQPAGASAPYLRLDPVTRRVDASAGCNGMSGEYTLEGESLRVGQVASTLMLCADSAIMERETALMRALEQVRRWRIEGSELLLLGESGTLGRFRPAASDGSPEVGGPGGIEEVTWRLASLGGRDPDGEPPFFRLTREGREVRGDGGCNNFRGTYELDGERIRMGPLASTRRACAEQSRNAQETALLAALEAATSWRVEGDRLLLLGATGELAVFRAEGR